MNITNAIDEFEHLIKSDLTKDVYIRHLDDFFCYLFIKRTDRETYKVITTIEDFRKVLTNNYFMRRGKKKVPTNKQNFKELEAFFKKKFNFQKISLSDLKTFLTIYGKKKSSTRNQIRSAFRQFWYLLHDAREISQNFLVNNRRFRSEKKTKFNYPIPSKNQLKIMIDEHCKDLKEKALITLIFLTSIKILCEPGTD